jgi:hypothetical protein
VENLRWPRYRAVLAIEIRQTHCVNFRRRPQSTLPISTVKSEAGVFCEEGFEPEVSSHPHRGFDGVVGDYHGDDESVLRNSTSRFVPMKAPFTRLAITVSSASGSTSGFEIVARLAGAIVGCHFGRVVTNVIDGAPGGPPRIEQGGDISLRIRVVALAPTWVIDSFLKIDHE